MLPEDKRIQLDGIVQQMVQNKESDSNIQFVVDDFKKKYTSVESSIQSPEGKGFGEGLLKSAGGLFLGASRLGQKILQQTAGRVVEKITGTPKEQLGYAGFDKKTPEGQRLEKVVTPIGAGEKFGKLTGDIAQFFIPGGAVGKVEKGLTAAKGLSSLSKLGAKSLLRGAESGTVSALQSGELGSETGISTGIGAVSPFVSAVGKALKPAVAPVLEFTSGVPKQAIKKAMSGDEAVKLGMNLSTETVRGKAVQAFKGLKQELGSSFSKGLEDLSKLSPRIKPARTLAQEGTPGVFSGVKGEFKDLMVKAKENIPKIFRDTRISVKNGKLDFDKLNSSIINPTEQKQLQAVYDTIVKQKDYSVKGVQDVASRLRALSKVETMQGKISSVPISKIHNVYDKAIQSVYPELGQLRSNYSNVSKILKEIDNVIGVSAKNPTQIQSSVTKLSNLYKTDKQTYLNVIEELSKRSGQDISGLLAGTEFNKVLPGFIRGIGGGGVLTASAALLNPLLLLLFPIFSPKLTGKIIQTAPKVGKALGPARKILTGLTAQTQP